MACHKLCHQMFDIALRFEYVCPGMIQEAEDRAVPIVGDGCQMARGDGMSSVSREMWDRKPICLLRGIVSRTSPVCRVRRKN